MSDLNKKVSLSKVFKNAVMIGGAWAVGGLIGDAVFGATIADVVSGALSNFFEAAIVGGLVSAMYENGAVVPDYVQKDKAPKPDAQPQPK